jgi:uncharacterized protein YndB with AHSA1/START domain
MTHTRVTQLIHAPRALVYRALLRAEDVTQWMVPDGMTSYVHAFDAREGGAFRITLTYKEARGRGKSAERSDTFHGRFLELVPDRKVVQGVEFETGDPAFQGESIITYTLGDADGDTLVLAVHEQLPPGLSPEDNETGFRMSLAKLKRLVEGSGAT